MLKWEASVYTAAIRGDVHLLKWLLSMQRLNKGTTQTGVSYRVPGCRMSGDMNTSLGNTIIQMTLLKSVCREIDCDILVEGDDAVVFANRHDIQKLSAVMSERGREIGMIYKLSSIASSLEEIDYCSTRLVETGNGVWRSVRDVRRALATDVYTSRPVTGDRAAKEKARLVAVCQAVQYRGLPVLHAWATYLLSHSEVVPRGLDEWYDRGLWLTVKERLGVAVKDGGDSPRRNFDGVPPSLQSSCAVTQTARSSFYCAWGLLPDEQVALERALLAGLGLGGAVVTDAEMQQLMSNQH
jgi:hypothetical protein